MGLRSRTAEETPPNCSRGRAGRTRYCKDELLARQAMAKHDAERESFVDELAKSVWSGAYDPSSEEIANAIIRNRVEERSKAE
ncbi:MAG TPA: hypothetical protein VGM37_14050 [Armatimonadota bacterium]|jgi:hypothetical protein